MKSTRSVLKRRRNRKKDVLPFREIPGVLFATIRAYFKENGLYHGAALAYYSLFAMAPLLYLLVNSLGRIMGKDQMYIMIEGVVKNNIGLKDASAFMDFIKDLNFDKGSVWMNMLSLGVLVFASSAFIVCLRRSINDFYDIRPEFVNRRNKIISNVFFRFLSVGLMLLITIIFFLFYFSQSFLISIIEHAMHHNRFWDKLFMVGLEHMLSIVGNVIIFSIVFKYVHDGIIRWKLAIWGAVLTSILLYLGQLFIDYYLNNLFFGSKTGGLAGTFFILLAYVYYSSQIIFFGAKFNAVYARTVGKPIRFKGKRVRSRYKRVD